MGEVPVELEVCVVDDLDDVVCVVEDFVVVDFVDELELVVLVDTGDPIVVGVES